MAEQLDNSRPVRELYEAINRRDLEVFNRIISEQVEYVEFGLGETVRGREAFKKYFQRWWKAFPQGKVFITNLIQSNDQVVIEAIGSGVESEAFETEKGSTSPQNKVLEFHYCKIFRVKDGVILSGKSYSDAYKLLGVTSQERRVA